MISNTIIDDIDNNKNDIEFDVEVMSYIGEKRFVRRRQLIDHIIDSHKEKKKYSRPSVERKLARLTKTGALVIIKYSELEKYGIHEKDKRASYLSLKEDIAIKGHLDEVFNHFSGKNNIDQNLILKELEFNKKKYVLDSFQLDVLVNKLDNKDDESINILLRMIYQHVTKRGIKPKTELDFLKNLKLLLERYPIEHEQHKNLRAYIIFLLGIYNDEAVVEQLIKDAKNDYFETKNEYWSIYTSKIIERNMKKLFYLENELIQNGKDKAAQFISDIKFRAIKLLLLNSDDEPPHIPFKVEDKEEYKW